MANAITIVIDRWAADEMFMPQFLDKLKLAAVHFPNLAFLIHTCAIVKTEQS